MSILKWSIEKFASCTVINSQFGWGFHKYQQRTHSVQRGLYPSLYKSTLPFMSIPLFAKCSYPQENRHFFRIFAKISFDCNGPSYLLVLTISPIFELKNMWKIKDFCKNYKLWLHIVTNFPLRIPTPSFKNLPLPYFLPLPLEGIFPYPSLLVIFGKALPLPL